MLSVIQLVTHAEVCVDGVVIGAIQKGIMALVGIEKTDTEKNSEKLFNKIINVTIHHISADCIEVGWTRRLKAPLSTLHLG
jgi:D-Tyr-tRNAtyr deacylase